MNPVTGNQTPVATGGSLVNPVSIAIGSDGDLYVLDLGCCGPIGGQPGLIRVDPANTKNVCAPGNASGPSWPAGLWR